MSSQVYSFQRWVDVCATHGAGAPAAEAGAVSPRGDCWAQPAARMAERRTATRRPGDGLSPVLAMLTLENEGMLFSREECGSGRRSCENMGRTTPPSRLLLRQRASMQR